MINSYFNILRRLFRQSIFEENCLGCEAPLLPCSPIVICDDCRSLIVKIYKEKICQICGSLIKDGGSNICGNCTLIKKIYFNKHISYGLYQGILRELILKYKYGSRHSLANLFSKMIFNVYEDFFKNKVDIIIAVPFDKKRVRIYDSTLLLAKQFAKFANLPYKRNILYKKKSTPAQAGLNYKKRCDNLKNVFDLKNTSLIKDKRLLLVDDVYTTGTTINECAKVLLPFCASVSAVTLAKAEK